MIISITVSHLFEDYFYEKELNKSREKSKNYGLIYYYLLIFWINNIFKDNKKNVKSSDECYFKHFGFNYFSKLSNCDNIKMEEAYKY